MNHIIKQKFVGYINDVEILDLQIYFSICSFIRALEKKYEINIDCKEITENIEMFISDIIEYNTKSEVDISFIDIEEHCSEKDIDYLLNRNDIEYNKYELEDILRKVRDIKSFKDRSIETKGK